MKKIFTLSALLVSVVLAAGAAATTAKADVDIYVDVAPPSPRVEVIPAPRRGYVWAPGYWAWRGHRHVWHDGQWVRARAGYRWVPDRWERDGDRYHYYRGYWDRD